MTPLQFLLVLRAHYKIALAVFILTVAGGITFTLLQSSQYTTSTSLVFDVKQDPIAGILLPSAPGYVATQVEIIRSDRVAQRVVRSLNLGEIPKVKQRWLEDTKGKAPLEVWLGNLLLRGLKVTPSPGSNIMTISFSSSDPNFAMTIANGFAQAYVDTNIELKVDPARQYHRWFGEQGKILRENLEKSQKLLSEFQQQKGIVAREEQLDTEVATLADLSTKLTAVQTETSDVRSKQRSGPETLPEVMQNPEISSLRNDISRLQVKLQEAAANLGTNHPQYKRMEIEIAGLKQELEAATKRVTAGFSTSREVGKDRESDLKTAIALQKKKLLELRNERDQLAVLQRDVDAAQNAYNAVIARYNQTSLESQATQSNVSVLTPAVEPLTPSSPNIPRNLALTLACGLLFAGGAAFLLELLDRRIRSADELADMLQMPVLAVIKRPARRLRLGFWRPKALPAP